MGWLVILVSNVLYSFRLRASFADTPQQCTYTIVTARNLTGKLDLNNSIRKKIVSSGKIDQFKFGINLNELVFAK